MKLIKHMRLGTHTFIDRLRRDFDIARENNKGVAAVEFALILPLMLALYIGTAEITTALMANRKMTIVSRALSDLVAQETDTSGVSNATLQNIFAAATSIMSPFSTTTLKMTVSSIKFVPKSDDATNLKAMAVWSIRQSSAASARPCGVSAISKVANTAAATYTTMPAGLYQAGTVIVADVEYQFRPNLGGQFLTWSTSQSYINMRHTTYMKPRTQEAITYNQTPAMTYATVCSPAPPASW